MEQQPHNAKADQKSQARRNAAEVENAHSVCIPKFMEIIHNDPLQFK